VAMRDIPLVSPQVLGVVNGAVELVRSLINLVPMDLIEHNSTSFAIRCASEPAWSLCVQRRAD
jgi:hypothetical protein